MNMYPCLRYRDPHAAITFLCDAFGFERKAVYTERTTRLSTPSCHTAAAS
jgi:uncharacterized glyoxalase superfamily protein PhnB